MQSGVLVTENFLAGFSADQQIRRISDDPIVTSAIRQRKGDRSLRFIGTDVDSTLDRPQNASLIKQRSAAAVASVDRRARFAQRVSRSRPAVVVKGRDAHVEHARSRTHLVRIDSVGQTDLPRAAADDVVRTARLDVTLKVEVVRVGADQDVVQLDLLRAIVVNSAPLTVGRLVDGDRRAQQKPGRRVVEVNAAAFADAARPGRAEPTAIAVSRGRALIAARRAFSMSCPVGGDC